MTEVDAADKQPTPPLQSPTSAAAYAVLGAISQGPTHGFAIARRLQPSGDLGRVWSLSRPLVYRELARLTDRDLVREEAGEAGDRGPRRTIVVVTAPGQAETDRWLAEPVSRVRDFRSMFLLKLALIDGIDGDPTPLALAQRTEFGRRLDEVRQERLGTTGFDSQVLLWRELSTRTAIDFVNSLLIDTNG